MVEAYGVTQRETEFYSLRPEKKSDKSVQFPQIVPDKVPLRGTSHPACCDQAACIYEARAWSYEQSRAYDPPDVSDVKTPPLSFGKSAPGKYLEMNRQAIILWHHRVGDADCLEEVVCSKDHASDLEEVRRLVTVSHLGTCLEEEL